MKFIRVIVLLLAISILLTGCWDQNIFERIGFILIAGFDKGSDGKTLFTYSLPVITPSDSSGGGGGQDKGDEKKVESGSQEAYLLREARELEKLYSPKQLEGGKVQNVLIGMEVAKEGKISDYLELYERDTQSSVQAWVIVVDGTANEFITKAAEFKGKPRAGMYINELIQRNSKSGYCPETSIITYDIENDIEGLSPIVPILKLEGDNIKVVGTALIDRDKMTGRIDTFETACLFLAMGKQKLSEITFDLPKDIESKSGKGVILTKKVTSKSRVGFKNNMLEITFDIKLKATLDEYTWGHIDKPEYRKKIEQSINIYVQSCLDATFKKLQAAKCDVFGIGSRLRAFHNGYWNSVGKLEGWKKIYPKITARFNVATEIIRNGEIK